MGGARRGYNNNSKKNEDIALSGAEGLGLFPDCRMWKEFSEHQENACMFVMHQHLVKSLGINAKACTHKILNLRNNAETGIGTGIGGKCHAHAHRAQLKK